MMIGIQAMVPGTDDQFLLIAYGLGWSEVTPDNLLKCRVNKDGSFEVIAGKGSAGADTLMLSFFRTYLQ